MLSWTIARRFSRSLRRNGFARFTSIVAITSVCLGTLAVCLSQSILAGYDEVIQGTAKRFGMHVTVQNSDGTPIANVDDMIRQIRGINGVASVTSAIRHETLVKSRSTIDGAVLVGLPEKHLWSTFSPLLSTTNSRVATDEVLVGSGLARRLRSVVGDSITLITRSTSKDQPLVRRARIGRLFTSGMTSYDDHAIVTSTNHAQSILDLNQTTASMLMINCQQDDDEPNVVQELQTRFRGRAMVLTYRDHFAAMWNWIDLQKRPIPVIMSLIAIVSMFTVVSTVLLSIVEKTRSLAVLATLGMSRWQLSLITAFRVLTTSFVGVVAGIVLSSILIVVQRTWHVVRLDGNIYYVQHLPVAFEPMVLVRSGMLILLAACAAASVPMIITMRVQPIRALRFR